MAVLRLAKPIDFCIDFFFFISQKKIKKNLLHSTQDLFFLSKTSKQALCLSEMGGSGGCGGGGNWEIQNGRGRGIRA